MINENKNYFGYMRISTNETQQSFNRQQKALDRYIASINKDYIEIFKDETTGANFERKGFKKLMRLIKPNDTIVFKDVSRFSREYENGYKMFMELLDKNVELVFLDNPNLNTAYIKTLINTNSHNSQNRITELVMKNVIELLIRVEFDRAESERTIMIKRIKDGLAATNKKSGRPDGVILKLSDELKADINLYLSDRKISKNSLAKKYRLNYRTICKYIEVVESGEKAVN